jgi:hypothetical protein
MHPVCRSSRATRAIKSAKMKNLHEAGLTASMYNESDSRSGPPRARVRSKIRMEWAPQTILLDPPKTSIESLPGKHFMQSGCPNQPANSSLEPVSTQKFWNTSVRIRTAIGLDVLAYVVGR